MGGSWREGPLAILEAKDVHLRKRVCFYGSPGKPRGFAVADGLSFHPHLLWRSARARFLIRISHRLPHGLIGTITRVKCRRLSADKVSALCPRRLPGLSFLSLLCWGGRDGTTDGVPVWGWGLI